MQIFVKPFNFYLKPEFPSKVLRLVLKHFIQIKLFGILYKSLDFFIYKKNMTKISIYDLVKAETRS